MLSLGPIRLSPTLIVACLAMTDVAAAEPLVWRTDYDAARNEASDKGLPLFVVVGTENCYYCRKLESGPLREPAILTHLQRHFVPLKIDAHKEPELARALRIQLYPTIILAGPDGKIHAFIEGYVDAARLDEHCKRTVVAVYTPAALDRDFEQAALALKQHDYPRAIALLQGIVREGKDRPIAVKAQGILQELERQGAAQQQRAMELLQRGLATEAIGLLMDTVRSYAGTQAAAQAADQLQRLNAQPQVQQHWQRAAAQQLLAAAREDFRRERYDECLTKCEQLLMGYAATPESAEGRRLMAEIRDHPGRLMRACEQLTERTVRLHLMLAETWQKQGKPGEAIACYEKVMRLAPGTAAAETAAAALQRLRDGRDAAPASMIRP